MGGVFPFQSPNRLGRMSKENGAKICDYMLQFKSAFEYSKHLCRLVVKLTKLVGYVFPFRHFLGRGVYKTSSYARKLTVTSPGHSADKFLPDYFPLIFPRPIGGGSYGPGGAADRRLKAIVGRPMLGPPTFKAVIMKHQKVTFLLSKIHKSCCN